MFSEDLMQTATRLVKYCRAGQEMDALKELYAEDAVSVEPATMPDAPPAEIKGVDAIRGKHEWWNNTFEVHSGEVDGPYLHGDTRFTVKFSIDATNKETGERSAMQEIAEYTTQNGKIVREEFFFGV
ncbi:MAG: nuclear transport factor 2 family protein [Pseudomonadota bacterium]